MPDIFIPKEKQKESNSQPITINQPMGIFTSFCKNPIGVTFQSQENNETILLFTRKHFATNTSWIFTVIFLLALPFLMQLLQSVINVTIPQFPNNYFLIARIFYYGAVFTYAFTQWITWYYNISLVTNKRIVDIDFSNLLFHDVAITKVDLVEDVTYRKTGFFASLFNYGDLFVQTAGETENFDFLQIPNPQAASELIISLIGDNGHD